MGIERMNTGSMDPNSAIMNAIFENMMKPYSSKTPPATPNGGMWGTSWQGAVTPQFDIQSVLQPFQGGSDSLDWTSGKTKTAPKPTTVLGQPPQSLTNWQSPAAGATAQGLGGWSVDPSLKNTTFFPQDMTGLSTDLATGFDTTGIANPPPAGGNALTDWLSKNQPIIDNSLNALTALNALTSMYTGWKGLDLAGDMFSFQKDAWNKNYANQVSDYNRQVTDLASARQGYDPTYDRAGYLKKNLLEGAV